ncbi:MULTISPECIES: NAD(P)/FAD-dependent oxidoreductase [Sulfurospirillum]|jgi:sulfide:quinone oxidoreductase|uniref:NAD(P)/FAD-dependent oxidoreductase n=1 Tax=Sulfurospirillum TaxID=57665 RepID=UPI000542337A|nr:MULTISPECIES: FAD/NAD(P)-binding oxidoreductase [Sulfurospirillum]KHG33410.1 MAG: sulfide:quinone reductase [Sulfurospirillum sp. MES]MCD8545666.1 NAD(P)/FAD-dependent oxidoreductase [Sulfurospirillum cavolei]
MKSDKIIEEILGEIEKHEGVLSRRDAMKLLAASPIAAGVLAGTTTTTEAYASSDAKGKIVIVGGGLAGVATAAKLTNKLSNPDITIIEPNPHSVSYQPGQTLVAAGVWQKSDITYDTANFIPKGTKWIKEMVVSFDPANNKVKTQSGMEVAYDYLVVATGLVLDFASIKGLEGEIMSSGDNEIVRKKVGKNGVYSIYFADGAVDTYKGIQELIAKAKAHTGSEKLQAIFTDPATAIKCGGAPKKIMYIIHDLLTKAGVRDKVELTFCPSGDKMFGVPEYNDAIFEQFKKRGFKWEFKTNLVAIDTEKKVATFEYKWLEKGEYDEDLKEYTMIPMSKNIEKKYDFIHITPPQKAPDLVGKSPIGSSKGWVPVVKETLQHVTYKNVFAIGDVAALPMAKTGGSARKEYAVLVDNLIAVMEKKEKLPAAYDGYTVCPLITSLGTVMLAEFNWTAKPTPSFPLDPTQERWIWWLLKVYALKPMTIYGMLSGRA